MTEECLALLQTCCSPEALRTLELCVSNDRMSKAPRTARSCLNFLKSRTEGMWWLTLPFQVRCVLGEGEVPPSGGAGDVYERLFASSGVSLRRGEGGVLGAEVGQQPGHLPLVLCIAIRGLASLAQ